MRILLFSLVYYPRFVGGAEVAIKEITDRIPVEDISFDMVTLRTKGEIREEHIGNVRVVRVGPLFVPFWLRKYLFPFVGSMTARRLHKKKAYDAVWSMMANYAGFAALFFKFSHKNIPFILTLQEGDSLEHIRHRVGILYPLFKRIFTRADRIQAISNYLAEWARYMGVTKHVSVIPNGVDVENFQLSISNFQKEELRNKLGIKENEKIIITTSRLVKKNGVGDLIEAMKHLPEEVKLFVVGTGHLEDKLRRETRSSNLEERVIFLGFIPHAELSEYLHVADVFCRPSLSEGLGISFLEAMASGVPVVATPVGGIPDFLVSPSTLFRGGTLGGAESNDKITGIFCEVNNPKSIAEKIQLLLSNEGLRQKIIENASKMVRENYDWDGIAKKMQAVFFAQF